MIIVVIFVPVIRVVPGYLCLFKHFLIILILLFHKITIVIAKQLQNGTHVRFHPKMILRNIILKLL